MKKSCGIIYQCSSIMTQIALLLVTTLIILSSATIRSEATTQSDALDWVKNSVGSQPQQCGEYINNYLKSNWGFQAVPLTNGAKDLFENFYNLPFPAGWQRYQNTLEFIPQKGDIAVFKGGGYNSRYGHAGIVTDVHINSSGISDWFDMVDANGGSDANLGAGTKPEYHRNYYNGILGFIRPVFNGNTNNSNLSGTYFITSKANSSQALNVYTSSKPKHLNNVTLYNANKQDPAQLWTLKKVRDSYVIHSGTENIVLNIYKDGTPYGNENICVYSYSSTDYCQLWVLEEVSGGYVIRSKANEKIVLTATGTSCSSNVNAQVYTGSNSQIWQLAKI